MGEVQSESVGKANRGLCYTGHCDCNGSKLETDIQRPVQAWRNASRYAEQQYDMGNVSAGKRSNTVPAAGELSGLHHGEGGKISTSDLDVIDKLAHSLKSIVTTCAMLEAENNGYSGGSYPMRGNSYKGDYHDGYSGRRGYYDRPGDMREDIDRMNGQR